MKLHHVVLVLSLSVVATIAVASTAAIGERQQVMKSNGAATKSIMGMLKGEAPFDLPTVQKALATYQENTTKFVTLFPEDSKTGEKTSASPKIWEDMAGFLAANEKFKADAKAASIAIVDEASFKSTMPNVVKNNCGSCHEAWRIKDAQ
ncbi:MAG: cytochrome c [Alphaproteobacteria bacterium]|nr:cytochrome c [Beijerinckiaceae bacterium]NBQ39483.1 cytochrome c [Alphaproteobacteria bacterium]